MADSTEPPAPPAPEVDNAGDERRLELLRDQKRELEAQEALAIRQYDLSGLINASFSEREKIAANLVEFDLRLQEINLALNKSADDRTTTEARLVKIKDRAIKTTEAQSREFRRQNDALLEITKKIDIIQKKGAAATGSAAEELKNLQNKREALEQELTIKKRISNIEKQQIRSEQSRIKQQLESQVPFLDAAFRFRKLQRVEGANVAGGKMAELAILQGVEGLAKGVGGLMSALGPLTSVAGIVQTLIEGLVEYRDSQVDLNRVILGNREVSEVYEQMSGDLEYVVKLSTDHGLAISDVKESLISMYKENSAFQHLIETSSRENIKDLTHLATTFKNLELSASDVAKVMDITTRNMQMSAAETSVFLQDVTDRASKAGQTVSQYVSNFTSQMPQLRIYGDNSVKIFNRINKQAQNTGASIAGIMNIGKQFETYESAATTATKLNMILGSNFDALKAISASPDEMVDMIRGQISPSDLESMGHLQRKYLSGVLGIEYDQLERIVQGKDIEKDKSPAEQMGRIVKDTDRIQHFLKNIAVNIGRIMNMMLESVFFDDGRTEANNARAVKELERQERKLAEANIGKVERNVGDQFGPEISEQLRLLSQEGTNKMAQYQLTRLIKDIYVSSGGSVSDMHEKGLFDKIEKLTTSLDRTNLESHRQTNELIRMIEDMKKGIKVHGNVNANIQEG